MKNRIMLAALFGTALLFQGCLLGGGGSQGEGGVGVDGVWLLTRELDEWTYQGITERDTTVYDAGDIYERSYLVIQGGSMITVEFNPITERADSTVLDASFIAGTQWLDEEGDTVTITRTGNQLTIEFSYADEVETYYWRAEFTLHVGAFPPPEWGGSTDTTGTGSTLNGSWILTRLIDTETEDGFTYVDTVHFDTTDIEQQIFFRIQGDSLFVYSWFLHQELGGPEVFTPRIPHGSSGGRWVDNGDTITLTRSGNILTAFESGSEDGYDWTISWRFVAYTGTLPPAAWGAPVGGVEIPAQSTQITVGAAATAGQLAPGGANWYRFTATAGTNYRIRTYGDLDTFLRLYNQSGTLLSYNDDYDFENWDNLNASIEWTAPSSGTYYFTVRGFDDDESGSYTVDVAVVSGGLAKSVGASTGSFRSLLPQKSGAGKTSAR